MKRRSITLLNLELSNSQLNNLKLGIKNGTEVNLKLPSSANGDSNDENNFLHKLLLNNTQVSKFRKTLRVIISLYIIIKNSTV